MDKLKNIFKIFILIILLSPVKLPVNASGEMKNIVAPAYFYVKFKDDQDKLVQSFTISNNYDSKIAYKISYQRKEKEKILQDSNLPNYVSIEKLNGEIDSHSNKTIDFTLFNKLNGKELDLLIIIEFYAADASSLKSNATINKLIPVEVLIQGANLDSQDFKISTDLKVEGISLQNLQYNISAQINNLSNGLTIKPVGYFEILDPNNNVIYQKVINENSKALGILESYKDLIKWDIPLDPFKVGNYTAKFLVKDPISELTVSKSITFFVIPFTTVFLIISLIITVWIMGRKIIIRAKFKEQREE